LKANVIAGAQEGRQGRKAREEERQDSEASKEEARQQFSKAQALNRHMRIKAAYLELTLRLHP